MSSHVLHTGQLPNLHAGRNENDSSPFSAVFRPSRERQRIGFVPRPVDSPAPNGKHRPGPMWTSDQSQTTRSPLVRVHGHNNIITIGQRSHEIPAVHQTSKIFVFYNRPNRTNSFNFYHGLDIVYEFPPFTFMPCMFLCV